MPRKHRNFWIDFLAKVGVPIFAASLVGCLLADRFEVIHGILMGVGLALIYLSHRLEYHTD